MIIQIFEVSSPEEAGAIARLGVEHVGVLVGKGAFPREIDYPGTRAIFEAVPPTSKRVALTLTTDPAEVVEVVAAVSPHIIFLGTGPESLRPPEMKKIRETCPSVEVMRTIPVVGEESVAVAEAFGAVSDYLLLDTQVPGESVIGATGKTHDWSVSRKIVETAGCKVVLAGGLGADNVEEAIRRVGPFGVDSKTLTDRADGQGKDLNRIARFCEAVRRGSR